VPTTHAKLVKINGQCQYLNITIIKISKYPVLTYNHRCKKITYEVIVCNHGCHVFLETPNNHLENHRFFRKLGGLEPVVLWSRFSQIPEDPEYCFDSFFFKYLELAVITKIREPPPHWCELWTSPKGYYSGVCKPRWSWFRV
jgi:hypothetical protein